MSARYRTMYLVALPREGFARSKAYDEDLGAHSSFEGAFSRVRKLWKHGRVRERK